MVYRFIDEHKESFGLRWLCRHFGISLNCYYNYLADKKEDYHKQREAILERIKYIFYNNNRTVGHTLIDKITGGEAKEVDGEKVQEVKIYYKFIGFIAGQES